MIATAQPKQGRCHRNPRFRKCYCFSSLNWNKHSSHPPTLQPSKSENRFSNSLRTHARTFVGRGPFPTAHFFWTPISHAFCKSIIWGRLSDGVDRNSG